MESKSSSGLPSFFITLATITGFLVDVVTLINFFSNFSLRNIIDTPPILGFAKITISNISLNLKDVMFVVIVYFLFALVAYISINDIHAEQSWRASKESPFEFKRNYNNTLQISVSVVGFNLLVLTTFLWATIFFFPTSILWKYIYYILEGWGLSVILNLLNWHWSDRQDDRAVRRNFGLMFLVLSPALILMNEFLFSTGFLPSIGITLILCLGSIVNAILANAFHFIFVETIVWYRSR